MMSIDTRCYIDGLGGSHPGLSRKSLVDGGDLYISNGYADHDAYESDNKLQQV